MNIFGHQGNYFYEECKIKRKLHISSIIKIKNENEKQKYESIIADLNDKNDSILIVQQDSNARYFNTSILKYINQEKKYINYIYFKKQYIKMTKKDYVNLY